MAIMLPRYSYSIEVCWLNLCFELVEGSELTTLRRKESDSRSWFKLCLFGRIAFRKLSLKGHTIEKTELHV